MLYLAGTQKTVGANSFAMQTAGLPHKVEGAALQPLANEFAPTRHVPPASVPTV
ncbi:hypothetical protein D9M69_736750 [compost metagenome]